ncbi:hypothetical protein [Terasakiella pusilla]|uniref:hypothetical protein n=1 Tax=Terasakiella pusilla TaxID=64973 RepID=UPI003AA85C58
MDGYTNDRKLSKGRPILLWVSVITLIIVIELYVEYRYQPDRADTTNFLKFNFAKGETVQRAIAFQKLKHLALRPANILQVGDSSGMHGIIPAIMESEIPGASYLNMNVATTLGYIGYYSAAKYALENQTQPGTIKHIVLYTTMIGGAPRSVLWDPDNLIGYDIQREFTSSFHRFFHIPSLGIRRELSHKYLYWGGKFKSLDAPLADNKGYLDATHLFDFSNGWVREHDVPGDIPRDIWYTISQIQDQGFADSSDRDLRKMIGNNIPPATVETFFDWQRMKTVSYFEHIITLFVELARKHNAKFHYVYNPFPISSKSLAHSKAVTEQEKLINFIHFEKMTKELARISKLFPDANIKRNFDFIEDNNFSAFSHIGTLFAEQNSINIASYLKENGIGEGLGKKTPTRNYPSNVKIIMNNTFGGYGWDYEGSKGSEKYWIGPRDAAALWSAVEPTGTYTLKAYVKDGKDQVFKNLSLLVNDTISPKLSSDEENGIIEWQIPSQALKKWNGWLKVIFSVRENNDPKNFWKHDYPLSTGKSIQFISVEINQQ